MCHALCWAFSNISSFILKVATVLLSPQDVSRREIKSFAEIKSRTEKGKGKRENIKTSPTGDPGYTRKREGK